MTWGRGSTRRWRELRAKTLKRDPVCQLRLQGCSGVSTQADHILNVEQYPHLEYDPSNIQGVCKPCHDQKSQAEATAGRWPRREAKKHPGLL